MARPLSYRDTAEAGAVTLNRMENDAVDERRYQDQLARQTKQDVRADAREDRLTQSDDLQTEMQRYAFEKQKTFDANAARMKIENDKQAIAANEELFKITTDTPDAPLKLAEWGAKYFRVLDEKDGDPRLIRQFQINQTRAEASRMYREKLEDERAKFAEKKAAEDARIAELKANAEQTRQEVKDQGLVPSGASVGDDGKLRTTFAAPKAGDNDSYEAFNKDLEEAKKAYVGQADLYKTTNGLPPAVQTSFEQRGKLLEAQAKARGGEQTPAPASMPTRTAVNPKTGERLVFQNGQWQPLK